MATYHWIDLALKILEWYMQLAQQHNIIIKPKPLKTKFLVRRVLGGTPALVPGTLYSIRTCHFCITFDFEDESYICYAFWVPYEVYIKDFSKFHHLTPVLSSWWFSIHLLELKIQMSRIPPCHTSKVVSWHVDCWYELHLWWSLSKIWLKVSKTVKNWQYCRKHQFSPVFETLSQILLR